MSHVNLSLEKRQKIELGLKPVREELNLKLVMADLRVYKLQGCGEIMNLFESLQKSFVKFEVPYFEHAISFINVLLTEVVTEHISHYTGLSYVLNLYELLEDSLDVFIQGEDIFKEFDKALERLEKMFEGKEENLELKQEDIVDEVMQDRPPQDIIDDGLASDFINEAVEGIDLVETNLLELEKTPENFELIDQIFRVMHTIKGTAGFLGIPVLGKVAHKTEDVLVVIRDKKRTLDNTVIDLLFKSIDTLKNLVNQIRGMIEGVDVEVVNIGQFYETLAICNDAKGDSNSEISLPKKPVKQDQTVAEEVALADEPPKEDAMDASSIIPLPAMEEKAAPTPTPTSTPPHKSAKPKTPQATKDTKAIKTTKVVEMLKVPAEKLDELSGQVGEMVVALSLLTQNPVISELVDRSVIKQLDHLEKITENLRDKVLGIRMFPISNVFSKLTRQVRDLSHKSNKKINLEVTGSTTLVDKSIIDNIYAPLMHIVRNSIDHGIESEEDRKNADKPVEGKVKLSALLLGDSIQMSVEDDGKGLDANVILKKAIDKGLAKANEKLTDNEIFGFIFKAGFSTAKKNHRYFR